MSLANLIQRGPSRQPLRIVLYGVEGIGKSTFAADAPSPIFIGPEDGFGDLEVARLPAVKSWTDVTRYIAMLTNEPHDFRTAVLDTLDHMERLLQDHICSQEDVASLEKIPYGKGYAYMADEWGRMVASLDVLRAKRSMHILGLAHAVVKPFKNPEGADYDRYILRMNEKAAALWKEWCDVLLFANYDVAVAADPNKKKDNEEKKLFNKGKARASVARRVIHTTRSAAFDAKNRYDLPDKLDLDFAAFGEAVKLGTRGAPPAVKAPPDTRIKDAATEAAKSKRWTKEQFMALLQRYGAKNSDEVPADRIDEVVTILAGAPIAEAAPGTTLAPANPPTTEHPSWADDRAEFSGWAAKTGVDLVKLAGFLGTLGRGAPHTMSDNERRRLADDLAVGEDFRAEFDAWDAAGLLAGAAK